MWNSGCGLSESVAYTPVFMVIPLLLHCDCTHLGQTEVFFPSCTVSVHKVPQVQQHSYVFQLSRTQGPQPCLCPTQLNDEASVSVWCLRVEYHQFLWDCTPLKFLENKYNHKVCKYECIAYLGKIRMDLRFYRLNSDSTSHDVLNNHYWIQDCLLHTWNYSTKKRQIKMLITLQNVNGDQTLL